MKNLKIFPKMFIQIFSILGVIVLLAHLLIFLIFPKTYLSTRKEEIRTKANEISRNIEGKDIKNIEETLNVYSKSSEIKGFIKGKNNNNEVKIGDDDNLGIDLRSDNNSLIIEEREISLNNGEKISVQFVSTADMKKDAKYLSLRFLPYTLSISLILSILVSLIYARSIKNNIEEIKAVTDKMMELDKNAHLEVNSKNEVDQLKSQINDLYFTLLKSIDDLELKNREIVRLEKLKYDFFRGASHELKTPLASLKIILENMKYNIGKYKNRDVYIADCIDIVDHLSQNISQILSISSLERFKDDEELFEIKDELNEILKKYLLLIGQRNLAINNNISDEKIYIGRSAFKIILSNLISNAVKYADESGFINIGIKDGWLYIESSYKDKKPLDIDRIFDINFNLSKEMSNGLGLYVVSNLLKNYNKRYKAEQDKNVFVFKIELSN